MLELHSHGARRSSKMMARSIRSFVTAAPPDSDPLGKAPEATTARPPQHAADQRIRQACEWPPKRKLSRCGPVHRAHMETKSARGHAHTRYARRLAACPLAGAGIHATTLYSEQERYEPVPYCGGDVRKCNKRRRCNTASSKIAHPIQGRMGRRASARAFTVHRAYSGASP